MATQPSPLGIVQIETTIGVLTVANMALIGILWFLCRPGLATGKAGT